LLGKTPSEASSDEPPLVTLAETPKHSRPFALRALVRVAHEDARRRLVGLPSLGLLSVVTKHEAHDDPKR
jgi:hypothetical protein